MRRRKVFKPCKACGKPVERFFYSPEPKYGTFCSSQCKQAANRIQKQCIRCEAVFETANHDRVFCSTTCKKRRPHCKGCNKEAAKESRWCSAECYRAAFVKANTRDCKECGRRFFRRKDKRNQSRNANAYCGLKCYRIARRRCKEKKEEDWQRDKANRQAERSATEIDRRIREKLTMLQSSRGDRIQTKINEALRRNECRGNLISTPDHRGLSLQNALKHLESKRLDPWLYKIKNKLSNADQRLKRKKHAQRRGRRPEENCGIALSRLAGDANSAEQG
jgi:hypothetical protein